MKNKLIKRREVLGRTTLANSTLYELMRAGKFPQSVQIGPRSVAWVEEEVDAWLEERVRTSGKAIGGTAMPTQAQSDSAHISFDSHSAAVALTGKKLVTRKGILKTARSTEELAGVYFLIKDGEIVYIGQSINVYSRVSQHAGSHEFDCFSIQPCLREELDILESIYIHAFQPPGNGKLTGSFSDEHLAPIKRADLAKMAAAHARQA